MFLVALLNNFFEFMDIYYLVLSQLVFKQTVENLIELLYPLYETRTRLKVLEKKFEDVQWDKILDTKTELINEEPKPELVKKQLEYVKLDSSIQYQPSGAKTIGEKRREYQALRDFCSYKEPVDILANYMELVV